MQIKELLGVLMNENVDSDEIQNAANEVMLEKIDIPSNISIDNTLLEIEILSKRLQQLHQANPRDPNILNKIVSLLELKMKLLGMTNVKADVQEMMDSQINNYKKRFLIIINNMLSKDAVLLICDKLAKEGL